MPDIVTDQKYSDDIRDWVSGQIGIGKIGGDYFSSIGIIKEGELVGGAIYHDFHGHMIDISLATTDKRWCTRKVLRALFAYPFEKLGVIRLGVTCSKKNKNIRNLMKKLGFKQEGCARKAFDGKNDAMVYSMLNTECRWLK